jgi:hypothetical protein
MKRTLSIVLTALTLAFVGAANAGQYYGGIAFLHTNTALVLPPGALAMSLYARGFTQSVSPPLIGKYTLSDGSSALATAFGFSRHTELGFTQILYQDVNGTRPNRDGVTTLIPGNVYLRFKMAGYPMGEHMFYGFMPALRYRVARMQDIHLEPYEGIGIEGEVNALFSYYAKPLYPDDAPSYHFNLGYLNHNDVHSATSASQEINYLISAVFPRPRFDYGFEVYGANFIQRPVVTVLSREDWLYVTPMLRYKFFKGLSFTAGLDVLLMGSKDTTIPSNDLPNYSKWRLSGKLDFAPSTAFYAAPTFAKADATGAGRERRSFGGGGSGEGDNSLYNRDDLFRWGIESRGSDIQTVNLDLEKLRQERKKAEDELKALKQKLEERQKADSSK